MKNRKGFTLIELLAVIVILALLMAVAIPSVTKYIETSRKEIVVDTIGGYISSITVEVNNRDYQFSTPNTIYAVPLECIELERGGDNPFGEWLQANDNYWAYVLIEYDSDNFSYNYGFTFKDSAGYGLYPTLQDNISKTDINVGYDDLNKPKTGLATNFISSDKWNGFNITSTTQLVVLEAESEGNSGDGKTTCTLCQKGSNYDEVEKSKPQLLTKLVKTHNTIITAAPTLTTSINNTSDASGLYSSTDTNSGNATYYFRGNVKNNYVSFAGLTWRIIRINEDGTVRLITNSRADRPQFNATVNSKNMYYSNGAYDSVRSAKIQIDAWYQANIVVAGYDTYVATGIFCEQAKVKSGNKCINEIMLDYKTYTPNFKCSVDGNGKGIINSKVGLITYDEVVHAGGYPFKNNSGYYLYNGSYSIWTMSPSGCVSSNAFVWIVQNDGRVKTDYIYSVNYLRPVINLNANVLAAGTGTEEDPYVVITE